MKIYRIVLTGGPCAGKTTYLNRIKESFKNNNIHCLIVPEAATLLINKGIDPRVWDTFKFQEMVLKRELYEEEENTKYINEFKNNYDQLVIIYDRGIYDNKAYFNNQDHFKELLFDYGLDGMQILDSYDMVLDLLSMATCKPIAYTTQNNDARKEDEAFARKLDKKTSNAWANHRNMKIISGACSIDEEAANILHYIYDFLNGNNVIQTQRFLVDDKNSNFYKFGEMDTIAITDTYLKINNENKIYKLSKRANFGCSYVFDTYTYEDDKKKVLSSTTISKEVYNTLYNTFEHLDQEVREEFSFVDNEILYRLCYYSDRTVLEVQKNDFNDIKIPDYIKVLGKDEGKTFETNHLVKKLHK